MIMYSYVSTIFRGPPLTGQDLLTLGCSESSVHLKMLAKINENDDCSLILNISRLQSHKASSNEDLEFITLSSQEMVLSSQLSSDSCQAAASTRYSALVRLTHAPKWCDNALSPARRGWGLQPCPMCRLLISLSLFTSGDSNCPIPLIRDGMDFNGSMLTPRVGAFLSITGNNVYRLSDRLSPRLSHCLSRCDVTSWPLPARWWPRINDSDINSANNLSLDNVSTHTMYAASSCLAKCLSTTDHNTQLYPALPSQQWFPGLANADLISVSPPLIETINLD